MKKVVLVLTVVALLGLGVAGLAQADEIWTFSDATHTGVIPNPNSETNTFLSSPGGVGLTATGYAGTGSSAKTALYRKFTPGDPSESGLGLLADVQHEIGTSNYIQLSLSNLIAAGFKTLTVTIGSIQLNEGYQVFGDNTADSFGDRTLPSLRSFTNTNTGGPTTDTFTVDLGLYNFLDINASFANVLIENGVRAAVPLPPSVLLMGSGIFGLALMGLRRRA
jgi:hypothetical protein